MVVWLSFGLSHLELPSLSSVKKNVTKSMDEIF